MSLFPGVALITGAASGISRAVAVSFAREGCRKIVLADRNAEGLEETARLIGELHGPRDVDISIITTDVLKAEQIDGLILKAVKRFGRIDYAVNGAGTAIETSISYEFC